MTTAQQSQTAAEIAAGEAAAQAIAPALGVGGVLAVSVATTLLNAFMAASNGGQDVTADQLAELMSADDAAKAADLLAQTAAIAKANAGKAGQS